MSAAAQAASFTNELGVGGTFRFLKNIAGLWLVQECRRDFARRGQEFDYVDTHAARQRSAGVSHARRSGHADFNRRATCRRRLPTLPARPKQPVPSRRANLSAAASKAWHLRIAKTSTLESILDRRFDVLHIVGGGGKNALLSQMTADAIGRPVVVGPYEATAMGNALVQAMATERGSRSCALAANRCELFRTC